MVYNIENAPFIAKPATLGGGRFREGEEEREVRKWEADIWRDEVVGFQALGARSRRTHREREISLICQMMGRERASHTLAREKASPENA